ncbi:hypothetical protein PIB30_012758 [Stylosanthes scabra]|uniref:Uncharacterized protein n=1 Tax=Stylosanthes scabra TaxID=79078 RepID=A0ABU6S6U6_9FABA|nr:hypothetical protein [Stylosanthes scabra]
MDMWQYLNAFDAQVSLGCGFTFHRFLQPSVVAKFRWAIEGNLAEQEEEQRSLALEERSGYLLAASVGGSVVVTNYRTAAFLANKSNQVDVPLPGHIIHLLQPDHLPNVWVIDMGYNCFQFKLKRSQNTYNIRSTDIGKVIRLYKRNMPSTMELSYVEWGVFFVTVMDKKKYCLDSR